jgi:hypothetical protein
MSTPPPERPGGQDGPPDTLTAIHAVRDLFAELLLKRLQDNDELRRRVMALGRALERLEADLRDREG